MKTLFLLPQLIQTRQLQYYNTVQEFTALNINVPFSKVFIVCCLLKTQTVSLRRPEVNSFHI